MQSFNLAFGQYLPGTSPLHRLEPEAKITCVLILIILANFLQTPLSIFLLIALCAILFSITAIPGRFILSGVKPFIWLFVLTATLQAVGIGQEDQVIFRVGPVYVSVVGVVDALVLSGKFFVIILFSLLLISTTSPQILIKIIVKWLNPLEKLKVPVNEIGLMMMVALRFLPILQEETSRIVEARKIRLSLIGAHKDKSKLSKFQELLFAIFVGVLRRSRELSLSMASRGYGTVPVGKWQSVTAEKDKNRWLFVIITLFGCIVLLLVDRYLTGLVCFR